MRLPRDDDYRQWNNFRVVGDFVRRTVSGRLDRRMETPEKYSYEKDPIAKIKNNRGGYLADVFTIARAFMNCRARPTIERINGFEEWSKWVQAPLVWLGEADPIASQEGARSQDPERTALRERIDALARYVRTEFTAADLLRLATEPNPADGRQLLRPELFEAFNCGAKNSKSIGRQLTRDLDRWSSGHCVRLASADRRTSNSYYLEKAAGAASPKEEPSPEEEPF